MPNFGSSQQVSGQSASLCKSGGGQRLNLWTVGYGGIGNLRNSPETVVVTGCAPTAPGLGKRTGPNEAPAFQPMFNSARQRFRGNFSISGQTINAAGSPLADCMVELNDSRNDVEYTETVSDGSGNYSFTIPWNSWHWQVIAYKVGSPDVAGVSVDTLTAVWNGN
jgi:hypothetical protein